MTLTKSRRSTKRSSKSKTRGPKRISLARKLAYTGLGLGGLGLLGSGGRYLYNNRSKKEVVAPQVKAEVAQVKAEVAKEKAEAAKEKAEVAQVKAEVAQVKAEEKAEKAEVKAEVAQVKAEKAEEKAEDAKKLAYFSSPKFHSHLKYGSGALGAGLLGYGAYKGINSYRNKKVVGDSDSDEDYKSFTRKSRSKTRKSKTRTRSRR